MIITTRLHLCVARKESPDVLARRVFAEMDSYCGKEQPDDDQTLVVIDFDLVTGGI